MAGPGAADGEQAPLCENLQENRAREFRYTMGGQTLGFSVI
jgi:hypothetical protein